MPFRFAIARRLMMLAVLALALCGQSLTPVSDFFQDYGAARAWREGLSPNTRTYLLAERYSVDSEALTSLQVAHPPAAVAIALPFSYLTWPVARVAWTILCWFVLMMAIERSHVTLAMLAVSVPMLVYGLALGALDPLVLALLLIAFGQQQRSFGLLGLALGGAIALKVYPALFLVGLWLSGQRRAAIYAAASGAAVALAATLLIGVESALGWIAFMPANTAYFVDAPMNISLTRYVRLVFPEAAPSLSAAIVILLLLIPLRLQRRDEAFGALSPVLILASPLTWLHYLPVLNLGTPIPPVAQKLLVIGGYGFVPAWLYLAAFNPANYVVNLLLIATTTCLTAAVVVTWLAAIRFPISQPVEHLARAGAPTSAD